MSLQASVCLLPCPQQAAQAHIQPMSTMRPPPPAKETGSTSLSKKALSFKWIINDADKIGEFDELKRSPCFSVLLKPATLSQPSWNSVWYLKLHEEGIALYHRYEEEHNKEESKEESKTIYIRNCRFYLLNNETLEAVEDGSECDLDVINNRGSVIECDNFKYDEYLYTDKLTIQVEADLLFVDDTAHCNAVSEQMCDRMHYLYKNEVLTDAIIRCDGMEFKVHRAVLASESPVFRAMFEADMKEKQSGVIEIADTTSAAMSDLLTYLYTGTAPNMKTLVKELLVVAVKYQVSTLVTTCEHELGDKIQEINVVEMLILADKHGSMHLKKACLDYIRLNSGEVFQTSEWSDFKEHKDQYAALFVEALEYILSK